MTATTKRPVYLNLLKIRLPIGGVLSILHRITGVVMILAIPLLIYLLTLSLDGAEGFAAAAAFLSGGAGTALLFLGLWAVFHHLLAGVRYLLIDLDVGVEKPAFRQTAWLALVAAPVIAAAIAGGLS
jgi:succinate dehydrogenase / fumarate reductase cytochrome b subunit